MPSDIKAVKRRMGTYKIDTVFAQKQKGMYTLKATNDVTGAVVDLTFLSQSMKKAKVRAKEEIDKFNTRYIGSVAGRSWNTISTK